MNPVQIGDATLHLGDCLENMKSMPDNSIDSIVTDPPYGLSFMGKKWDYDVPSEAIWRECLRVLKPGGHLLAFAGTRTQHRMAAQIEDAGFEIRDMIAWVYGCLDEATEVATENGVMPYHKTKIGDRVLCYDVENGEYTYQPILEIVEYDYSDTAFRLVGDFGEQVVSRNHRVIVERGGSEAFQLAETLECEARVPVLESMPALRQAIHDAHQGAGRHAVRHERTAQGIRAWGGHRSAVVRVVPFHYTGKVWCLRVPTGAFVAVRNGVAFPTGNSGFPKSLDVSKAIDKAAGAEREVVGQKHVTNAAQGKGLGHGDIVGGKVRAGLIDVTAPATDAARQWSGWGTALKPALETVTFASKPYTDEQERDIIQSNLIRLEARLWLLSSASAAAKSSTSNQSEYGAACAIAQWSAEEIISTRAALCDPMGTSLFELATTTSLSIVSSWRRTLAESWNDGSTSTIETNSSTTTDLRTLKFSLSQITPASIIKACSLPGGFSANASTAESHFNASLSLLQSIRTLSATEPAISQEAENFRGADVKPNLDPCIMARKPLIGTVAENVLAHGTGGLNIDGCRVAAHDGTTTARKPSSTANTTSYGKSEQMGGVGSDVGRWPANLIHNGSDEVLAAFPQAPWQLAKASTSDTQRAGQNVYGVMNRGSNGQPPRGDAGSAARFFYCAKASRKDRNEGCEGMEQKMPTAPNGAENAVSANRGSRSGPRENHHPTVKPTDLMRYLCRLVTPPGGVVLDPFTGSGSTGKAAILEGFRFIGIEREAEYVEIARARIAAASAAAKEAAAQPDLFNGATE